MQFSNHLLKRGVQKVHKFQTVLHVSFALFRALSARSLSLRRVGKLSFWMIQKHVALIPFIFHFLQNYADIDGQPVLASGSETWSYRVWYKNYRIQGASIEQSDFAFHLLTETVSGSRKGSLQDGKL